MLRTVSGPSMHYTVFVTRTHIKANIDTALGRTARQTRSRHDIRAVRLLLHSTDVCAFFKLLTIQVYPLKTLYLYYLNQGFSTLFIVISLFIVQLFLYLIPLKYVEGIIRCTQ